MEKGFLNYQSASKDVDQTRLNTGVTTEVVTSAVVANEGPIITDLTANDGDVNLVTRVDTSVQDTSRKKDASTSPKMTNSSFANVVNATRNVQL